MCDFEDYQLSVYSGGGISGGDISGWYEIELFYSNIFVEKIETVPSYDIQNLIAEVGGNASLFLGLSGMGILEPILALVLMYIMRTKTWAHNIIERSFYDIAKVMMWLAFVYWATQAIINYKDEPLSTESSHMINKIQGFS